MINKILVPLDGSKLAEKSLPYAELLAQKFSAALILVRVEEPIPVISELSSEMNGLKENQPNTEASLYLNSIKGELRELHIPARTVVAANHGIAETLLEIACEKNVDLVVMSTHGRSGLGRWVYGSVANKVLGSAPCPVFLVRAKENQ